MNPPLRYRSTDEDSGRWLDFPFRDGDIVISTRSKSGTTWMQMICAMLVFQEPVLPRPLGELSPWVDWLVEPYDELLERLDQQWHRRILKTHTPLDGVVIDPRATYIVVARHPLDMAVSLYHQGDNIDRRRVEELTGVRQPDVDDRPPLREWLRRWIAADPDPREAMDSLPGVFWHLSDAWRRRDTDNVVLVRYADLHVDLGGQLRGLAERLGIDVAEQLWPTLAAAASFDRMRTNAAQLVPATNGVLKQPSAFFRRGRPGAALEVLDAEDFRRYEERAAELASADLLAWLHGE